MDFYKISIHINIYKYVGQSFHKFDGLKTYILLCLLTITLILSKFRTVLFNKSNELKRSFYEKNVFTERL